MFNHHALFLRGKVLAKGKQTHIAYFAKLPPKGNAYNSHHEEDPDPERLKAIEPAHCHGPHHIEDQDECLLGKATAAAAPIVVHFVIDEGLSKGKEQKEGNLEELHATGNANDGQAQEKSGRKPHYKEMPSEQHNPEEIEHPRADSPPVAKADDFVRGSHSCCVVCVGVCVGGHGRQKSGMEERQSIGIFRKEVGALFYYAVSSVAVACSFCSEIVL
jgi:hypothetical protein